MKKLLLLMLFSSTVYSQLNFGAKASIVFLDNLDKDKNELFYFDETMSYSGFLEYRFIDVSTEFELSYYSDKSDRASVKALIPSVSIKYYVDENFNLKTGIYVNSSSLDYKTTIAGNTIYLDNLKIEDIGLLFGMEAILYKGLFLDARFFVDLNGSDDIRTKHLFLGAGYKF